MSTVQRNRAPHMIAITALALGVFLIGVPTARADGADVYGVGAGSINLGGSQKAVKFSFSAHSGPTGDFGSVRLTIEPPLAPLDVDVDVDCVHVLPNPPGAGGWVGGRVKRVTPSPNAYNISPGDELLFGINDYGNPNGAIPDQFNLYFGSPQLCKQLGPIPQIPISQGNINIKLP